MKLRILVSMIAIMGIASLASANLLLNSSFELGTGQGGSLDAASIDNWVFWGGGWWANDAGAVHDGSWAIKRWDSGTGMYQDFNASAGETYDFGIMGYDNSGEALNDRWLNLSVEWFDAGNGTLGSSLLGQLTAGGSLDTWRQVSGSAAAPVNTSYGRIILVTEGGPEAGGALYFDSASVTAQVIPEPGTMALLGMGFLGLVYLRRKNSR